MGRLTIPEVVEQFAAYYEKPENGAWGSLHVVLDDIGNVNDDSVRGVIDFAREKADVEGEYLGELLLRLTRTQRAKLPSKVDEFLQRKYLPPSMRDVMNWRTSSEAGRR